MSITAAEFIALFDHYLRRGVIFIECEVDYTGRRAYREQAANVVSQEFRRQCRRPRWPSDPVRLDKSTRSPVSPVGVHQQLWCCR